MKPTENGEGKKNNTVREIMFPVVGAVLGAFWSLFVVVEVYEPFGDFRPCCLVPFVGIFVGVITGMLVEMIMD